MFQVLVPVKYNKVDLSCLVKQINKDFNKTKINPIEIFHVWNSISNNIYCYGRIDKNTTG